MDRKGLSSARNCWSKAGIQICCCAVLISCYLRTWWVCRCGWRAECLVYLVTTDLFKIHRPQMKRMHAPSAGVSCVCCLAELGLCRAPLNRGDLAQPARLLSLILESPGARLLPKLQASAVARNVHHVITEVNFMKIKPRVINTLFHWAEFGLLVLETFPNIRKLGYGKIPLYIREWSNKCSLGQSQGGWLYRWSSAKLLKPPMSWVRSLFHHPKWCPCSTGCQAALLQVLGPPSAAKYFWGAINL